MNKLRCRLTRVGCNLVEEEKKTTTAVDNNSSTSEKTSISANIISRKKQIGDVSLSSAGSDQKQLLSRIGLIFAASDSQTLNIY